MIAPRSDDEARAAAARELRERLGPIRYAPSSDDQLYQHSYMSAVDADGPVLPDSVGAVPRSRSYCGAPLRSIETDAVF